MRLFRAIPVRDVLWRAHLWERLAGRIHATPYQALQVIDGTAAEPAPRSVGIDERDPADQEPTHA